MLGGEEAEAEHPDLVARGAPDRAAQVEVVGGEEEPREAEVDLVEVEHERLQPRRRVAGAAAAAEAAEKAVEERGELGGAVPSPGAGDADGGGGPPHVAPAPGQHARPHDLVRRERGEDADGASSSSLASRRRRLARGGEDCIPSNGLRALVGDGGDRRLEFEVGRGRSCSPALPSAGAALETIRDQRERSLGSG